MGDDEKSLVPSDWVVESIKAELEIASPSKKQRIYEAIALAALGSIPWLGGVIAASASAAASYKSGESELHRINLLREWLQEHQDKLADLRATLLQIVARLDGFGEEVEERITSHEYLVLVRKTFRQWDQADTDEKRRLLVQLITNAGGIRIVSDDILRLFLDWIDSYHESHFAVIRTVYERRHDPPTRYEMWVAIYGPTLPRDDSADADLYRMLIRDLSTGGVIRQPRETDNLGRYRTKVRRPKRAAPGTMKSAFDDEEEYVLTDLGSQFVSYTMNELVQRLGGQGQAGTAQAPADPSTSS